MIDILSDIKKRYMDSFLAINIDEIRENAQKDNETITLYHGTTTDRLNSILKKGLLPRKETGFDNWEWNDDNENSIENVVYLSNKWHYFYAFNTWGVYLMKKYGENFEGLKQGDKYLDTFACYVECKVPKALLVIDEDFIKTRYMEKKIKSYLKRNKEIVFDPLECLAQYGTVGVLGGIPPSMITSFTVLADLKLFHYVTDENSPYHKEWYNWQLGKGKGKISLKQMLDKEAESDMNGTWWVHEIKKDCTISFVRNPMSGKIAMIQKPRI